MVSTHPLSSLTFSTSISNPVSARILAFDLVLRYEVLACPRFALRGPCVLFYPPRTCPLVGLILICDYVIRRIGYPHMRIRHPRFALRGLCMFFCPPPAFFCVPPFCVTGSLSVFLPFTRLARLLVLRYGVRVCDCVCVSVCVPELCVVRCA